MNELLQIFGDDTPGEGEMTQGANELDGNEFNMQEPEDFMGLTGGAIDTAVTALRDQMLLSSKLNVSELERE